MYELEDRLVLRKNMPKHYKEMMRNHHYKQDEVNLLKEVEEDAPFAI